MHRTDNKQQESWLSKCTVSAGMFCTVSKWKLGLVGPCRVVCKLNTAQLLTVLCSLNAQLTDCVLCGRHI